MGHVPIPQPIVVAMGAGTDWQPLLESEVSVTLQSQTVVVF